MVAAIVFAAFSVSVGSYRSIVVEQKKFDLSQISDIHWVESFKSYFQNTTGEARNYFFLLDHMDENNILDYGFFHWNRVIEAFVPRQLVGSELKESLKYPIGNYLTISERANYEYPGGQTSTGMLDAFESFWYFGCIEFFIIGYLMKWLYIRAKEGDIKHRFFYLVLLTPALHTLTHETAWLTVGFFTVFLFTFPIFLFCFRKIRMRP